jgi:hypothetical protein
MAMLGFNPTYKSRHTRLAIPSTESSHQDLRASADITAKGQRCIRNFLMG